MNNSWSNISSPEIKKQKLKAYIKAINKNITSADGHITADKNLLLFNKFRNTFLELDDTDVQMKDGEITSIKGVEILANHLLYIDGAQNPKLNIKTE